MEKHIGPRRVRILLMEYDNEWEKSHRAASFQNPNEAKQWHQQSVSSKAKRLSDSVYEQISKQVQAKNRFIELGVQLDCWLWDSFGSRRRGNSVISTRLVIFRIPDYFDVCIVLTKNWNVDRKDPPGSSPSQHVHTQMVVSLTDNWKWDLAR